PSLARALAGQVREWRHPGQREDDPGLPRRDVGQRRLRVRAGVGHQLGRPARAREASPIYDSSDVSRECLATSRSSECAGTSVTTDAWTSQSELLSSRALRRASELVWSRATAASDRGVEVVGGDL